MISIKKYRGAKGYSQQEFSQAIGVTRQYLSMIEQDGTVAPVNIVEKIAETLEVSPIVLYGLDNFKIKPNTVEEKQFVIDLLKKSIEEGE